MLLSLSGCDGSGGPVLSPDGGSDAFVADTGPDDGSVDAGRDAGSDTEAPRVTSTRPRSGETNVPLDREVEIRFSERILLDGGTVSAEAEDGTAIALAEIVLDDTRDVVRVRPATAWPTTSGVLLTIEGFGDLAGNVMTAPAMLGFTTADFGPPAVVASSPAEGATGVDVALDVLTVSFSEAMSPHLGRATLRGGPGVVASSSWTSEDELRVELSGLENATSYALALEGFEDVEGNALDTVSYLVDGAIDFTTAGDEVPPTLVDSLPTNHQTDIDVVTLPEIALTFSERMDTSIRTAELTAGAATSTLTGNWNEDGTELRFVVASRLALAAEHHLDLSALRDRAGNALTPDVGLDAGVLVFTTTATDEALPVVLFSSPGEGSTDFRTRSTTIDILFSEAMVTTTSSVTLASSVLTRELAGTWNAAGTRLTLAVGAPLPGRTPFTIDLRAFTDASGNALDATHPYLADGVLDFTTGGPTGESCADPLTLAESTLDGAAHVWDLSTTFVDSDAPPSCAAATLDDGFVAYEKTTPALGEPGGRALRITATMSRVSLFNLLSLEVSRDVCDPAAPGGGDAAREVCVGPRRQWVQYLDVPAGTHFVSLAISTSDGAATAWSGAELRIEEVESIPEGEGCGDPFDASSSIHTSPEPDLDVFMLPHGSGTSVEQSRSTEDTFSCGPSEQGPDAVIQIEKRRDSSILDVTLDPFPADTGTFRWAGTHIEARTTCELPSTGTSAIACQSSATAPRTFQIDADAGPLWLWVAAYDPYAPLLRNEIRIHEIDPAPGESCRTAIPITVDTTNAITPSATTDYFHPSCLPAGAVTWYRYTTTREVTSVMTTGAAPVAMIDASSSAELACVADATLANIGRRLPVGTDVCVAVPSSMGPSAIIVRESDWRGIGGTPTTLPITRPVDGAGAPVTITSESWLEASPDSLFLGINVSTTATSAFVIAPRTGGEASRVLTTAANIGHGAAMRGNALFSIDERTTAGSASRLYRLMTGAGAIDSPPTAWDPSSTYPNFALRGLTRMDDDRFALAGANSSGAQFFTASATAAAAIINRGTNANFTAVNAIAADASYLWISGSARVGTTSRSSIWRLPWSDVTSAPRMMVPFEMISVSTGNAGIVYDAARDIVYFRSARTNEIGVYAIFDASTETPLFAGRVVLRGRSGDAGLALDPAIPALFLFETESDTNGAFVEVR